MPSPTTWYISHPDRLKSNAPADVRDAGIIADAQRIKHYKISAYGTAVQFAGGVDEKEGADKLQETLIKNEVM